MIIGYIEDSRPAGPLPMAARNPQLAALVRQRGGDGLLLNSDTTQLMGSISTASATATGWGSATTFGNLTNFSGGAPTRLVLACPCRSCGVRDGSTSSNTSISFDPAPASRRISPDELAQILINRFLS
jgi:hypothetical protein